MRRTAHRAGDRGEVRAAGIARTWRTLAPDRRLAALASIGLFLTLFLDWYQVTVIARGQSGALQSQSIALTGWGAFSFVEAAVLLAAGGVLTLLYRRAQGRAFHLPGGDGSVITAAGAWTCLLIIWRIFDKQGTNVTGPGATTSGIEWGIFVALAVAALLTYAGSRIRAANQPEPPLPGERTPAAPAAAPGQRSGPIRSPQPVPADGRATEPINRRPAPEGGPATEPINRRPVTADRPTTERIARDPTTRVARDPRFGEAVVPNDPPTLRLARTDSRTPKTLGSSPAKRPEPDGKGDDQLTMPLDSEGFEEL